MTRFSVRTLIAALVLILAGCTTVYTPRYGASGVYYDDPAPHYGGGYSGGAVYDGAWAANPVYYPYWSLDYFYFSQFYHPYSVVVGSWDPFYYPYPGWRYGSYFHRPGLSVSLSFGDPWWGYPWHGYGYRWRPSHFGYFGGVGYSRGWHDGYGYGYGDGRRDGYVHERHRHPVHRANDRLRMLQQRERIASRDVMLAGRGAGGGRNSLRAEQPMLRAQTLQHKRGEVSSRSRANASNRIDRRAESTRNRAPLTSRASLRNVPQNRAVQRRSDRATVRSIRPVEQRSTRAARGELRRPVQRASQPQRRTEVPDRSAPANRSVDRPRLRTAPGLSPQPANAKPQIRANRRVIQEAKPRQRGARPPSPRIERGIRAPSRSAAPRERRPVQRTAPPRIDRMPTRTRPSAPPPRVDRAPARSRPAAPPSRPAVRSAPPRSSSRIESRRSGGSRERVKRRRDSGRR
jgi:hypothetical protein